MAGVVQVVSLPDLSDKEWGDGLDDGDCACNDEASQVVGGVLDAVESGLRVEAGRWCG